MSYREFQDRSIEIIDFDDVITGERVLEFRDSQGQGGGSIVAVMLNEGDSLDRARISVNPQVAEVPLRFMQWIIGVSEEVLA